MERRSVEEHWADVQLWIALLGALALLVARVALAAAR
jgi:hypothetical protein